MQKAKVYEIARNTSGVLAGIMGPLGFIFQSMTLFGAALFFAAAWILFCFLSVNLFIEDEVERVAPRHRRKG